MNLVSYAIRNGATMKIAVLLIILGGIFTYNELGRLEDPEFTIKEAVVYTHYHGATAEQVELEVTEPLETAVQQLKQLKEVRSISRAGLSILFVEIKETYDKETLPQVWDELRRKVDAAAGSLPAGCGPPLVNDDFGDVYGVLFALSGDGYSRHALKEIAQDMRRELLLCTDVGRIEFWGMPNDVLYVEIDRAKLVKLGIAPQTIFDAITQQNSVTEAGKVRVGPEDVRLRVSGDYGSIRELEDQLIEGGPAGHMIRLKDIARIEEGYRDPPDEIMLWNGKPALGIGISTVSGGDVIAMGDSINQRLEELKQRIPVGVEVNAVAHQSDTVKESVRGFEFNLFSAVVIVILLLVLFMGLREGFIIGFVLLLTILATFVCMHIQDITLQRISLGALIIALGMLVDNAIVVAEGIGNKIRQGMGRHAAAEETIRETQWPLLGATCIAILAFAAITLSKDMTGEWLKSLFQVICLSLGLSWILAITVTPYLCVTFISRTSRKASPSSADSPEIQNAQAARNLPNSPDAPDSGSRLATLYGRFIGTCIDHRWITQLLVLGMLITAMWGFGFVKQDFMPDMNRPQITIDVWLPEGGHIQHTADTLAAIENHVRSHDGVTDVAAFIGRGPLRFLLTFSPEMPNAAYGQLLVSLDDHKIIPALKAKLNRYLAEHHPNAVSSVDAFKLGPGGGSVVARLSGPDAAVLRGLAHRVEAIMAQNNNTRSIRTDWGEPVKTQTIHLAETRAREAGITRPDLARALTMNYSGAVVGTFRHGDDQIPIMLRPPREQRRNIENVENIHVWSQTRKHWVPAAQVADGQSLNWELPVIHRLNRMRVLRVSCKQINGTTDGLFRQLKEPIESMKLPKGYTVEWGGEHEEQVEANTKLMSNVPIALTLMFLISVMLFNTLRHPLIIFLGLPLAIIGVSGGLLLADKPFGFMAMLGFLSLSGMLIKNEIVLLSQINIELAQGKAPFRAVIDAATSRVRPVCMAAITTVLGMTPLIWDAFFAPMAVVIMGGLTFATLLTLVVAPVLYCTFFRVHRNSSRRAASSTAESPAVLREKHA
jgi:multidrug efflux pump subunit AcrB